MKHCPTCGAFTTITHAHKLVAQRPNGTPCFAIATAQRCNKCGSRTSPRIPPNILDYYAREAINGRATLIIYTPTLDPHANFKSAPKAYDLANPI